MRVNVTCVASKMCVKFLNSNWQFCVYAFWRIKSKVFNCRLNERFAYQQNEEMNFMSELIRSGTNFFVFIIILMRNEMKRLDKVSENFSVADLPLFRFIQSKRFLSIQSDCFRIFLAFIEKKNTIHLWLLFLLLTCILPSFVISNESVRDFIILRK